MKKIIAIFIVLFLFVIGGRSYALDMTDVAKFVNKYKGRSIFNKAYIDAGSELGVVIIEDAHCNIPVQKVIRANLKEIVNELKNFDSLNTPLVLQEGGNFGPIRTELLKKNKTTSQLKQYIEDKFAKGEMGAAEYLHIKNNDFKFWGIEKPELYKENYKYFIKMAERREEINKFLDELELKIKKLEEVILSEELKEFYKNSEQEISQDNIAKYLEKIRLYVLQYGIDMRKYKTMLRYFDTQKALSKINKDNLERDLAIISKRAKLDKNLDNIEQLLADNIITLKETPELYRYAKLRAFFMNTDMFNFVKEKDAIEQELLMHIAYTEEEKELIKNIRYFAVSKKILSLTLTNEEYAYYQAQVDKNINPLAELLNYIKSYYTDYNSNLPLDLIYNDAKNFYIAVDKRDHVLASNIVDAMKRNNVKVATVILGGFHTEGIVNLLKNKKISYAIITPELQEISDYSDTYYEVMQRFWSR